MIDLFMYFLPLSIKACVVIPLIMAVRFFIRKQPKIYSYVLWGVVFAGLIFNIQLDFENINPVFTPVSQVRSVADRRYADLLDNYVGITETYTDDTVQYYQAVEQGIVPQLSHDGQATYVVTARDGISPPTTVQTGIMPMLAVVWAVGILTVMFYLLRSLLNFNAGLVTITKLRDNIYLADGISSPCVCGFFKPRVCIPVAMADLPLNQIIAHEQVHIRRKDYIIKPLCLVICVIHWFNPLVWLAFRLMCSDMEMSCDEAVVRTTGGKKEYSLRLLNTASGTNSHPVAAVLFGESHAESRIRNILTYRKPARLVSVLLYMVVAITFTACMVGDKAEEILPEGITQNLPKTFYEQLAEINDTEEVEYLDRSFYEGINRETIVSIIGEEGYIPPDTLTYSGGLGLSYNQSKYYRYNKNGRTSHSYVYKDDDKDTIYVHTWNTQESIYKEIRLKDGETLCCYAGGFEPLNENLAFLSYITEDSNSEIWLNIDKINTTSDKEWVIEPQRYQLDKNNWFAIRGLRFLNKNVIFMGQTDLGYIKPYSLSSSFTKYETPQANISVDGGETWLKLDFSQLALPEYFTGYKGCCMTLEGDKIEFRYFVDWQDGVFPWYTGAEPYSIISYDGGLTWAGFKKEHKEGQGFVFTQITDTIPVSVIE